MKRKKRKLGSGFSTLLGLLLLVGAGLGAAALISWRAWRETGPELPQLPSFQVVKEEKVISGRGTVRKIPLEGGFYGLVSEEGEKLNPLNLPPGFKEDGLEVIFEAEPKEAVGIQMWGRAVEIRRIEEK